MQQWLQYNCNIIKDIFQTKTYINEKFRNLLEKKKFLWHFIT